MSDLETITARVKDDMQWWTSIQIDVLNEFKHSPESVAKLTGDASLATQTVYQYTETSSGQRRLVTSQTLMDGRVQRTENFLDGRKSATVGFDKDDPARQKQVSIGRSFGAESVMGGTERPMPLKYYYVGKIPLYEAMENARELGEGVVDSMSCDRYMFDDVTVGQIPQNLLYYIRQEDSLPVQIESYNGKDPDSAHRRWVWAAEKIDVVDGRPFVVKSSLTAFKPESTTVRTKIESQVTKVAFNVKVSQNVFQPTISSEADVHDMVSGKTRFAPRDPDAVVASIATPAESVGIAVPPSGLMPLTTYASLGLGALLVTVALVVNYRR